jgi:hypothetical protein
MLSRIALSHDQIALSDRRHKLHRTLQKTASTPATAATHRRNAHRATRNICNVLHQMLQVEGNHLVRITTQQRSASSATQRTTARCNTATQGVPPKGGYPQVLRCVLHHRVAATSATRCNTLQMLQMLATKQLHYSHHLTAHLARNCKLLNWINWRPV